MNILVVSHENDLSGANKSLLSVINGLKSKHNFVVLVNSKNGDLSDELKKIGIKVIYSHYTWWYAHTRVSTIKRLYHKIIEGLQYYSFNKIDSNFVTYLKKFKFDLVYTNTSTIEFGLKLSKKLSIPHVWHLREFGKEDFNFQPLRSYKYYRNAFSSTTTAIAISNAIKNKYSNLIGKDKITVVYNGFNINNLLGPIHEIKDNCFKILITGQVSESKGQDQAISACRLLANEGLNIELYIAGKVDWDYINKHFQNIEENTWCHFLGQVNDMNELRRNMDLELCCSRSEAFGRVTIEAMLAGIPIIVSDKGANTELVDDGITGLVYKYENINSLKNRINDLYYDHIKYHNIAYNAQNFAIQFTINRTCLEIDEVFYNTYEYWRNNS